MSLSEEHSSPSLARLPQPRGPKRARPPTDEAISRFLTWAVEDDDDAAIELPELHAIEDEVTEPTLVLPTLQHWWARPAVDATEPFGEALSADG